MATGRSAPSGDEPSALGQAVLFGQQIVEVERQIQHLTDLLSDLRRGERDWLAGARGEQSVVRVLVGMDDAGWHVLPDRRWPGTRNANIDVLVVGPAGVFVIDVKNWRDFRVEGGRLFRGQADADDELRKLTDQTEAVEQVLVDAGLPPTEVVPLLVMAGRGAVRFHLDRVTILGERDLTLDLLRRGVRLDAATVEVVLEHLERSVGTHRWLTSVSTSTTGRTRSTRSSRGGA